MENETPVARQEEQRAGRRFKVRSSQIALYRCVSDNVELCQPAAILRESRPYGGPRMVPVNSAQEFKTGDLVHFAVSVEPREESQEWLRQQG